MDQDRIAAVRSDLSQKYSGFASVADEGSALFRTEIAYKRRAVAEAQGMLKVYVGVCTVDVSVAGGEGGRDPVEAQLCALLGGMTRPHPAQERLTEKWSRVVDRV